MSAFAWDNRHSLRTIPFRPSQESSSTYETSERTQVAFGVPISPHLFRDCAATTLAIEDPAHVGAAATILGHACSLTTHKHYIQANTLAASQRIRHEEELPVYERLGDVRLRAVTKGKIADILQGRGELDEALRIRREEQLPVYQRLGDVRERSRWRADLCSSPFTSVAYAGCRP